jgi:hypothetical protein
MELHHPGQSSLLVAHAKSAGFVAPGTVSSLDLAGCAFADARTMDHMSEPASGHHKSSFATEATPLVVTKYEPSEMDSSILALSYEATVGSTSSSVTLMAAQPGQTLFFDTAKRADSVVITASN